jgi:hypothetical protein
MIHLHPLFSHTTHESENLSDKQFFMLQFSVPW